MSKRVKLTTFQTIEYYQFGIFTLLVFSPIIWGGHNSSTESNGWLVAYGCLVLWITYTYYLLYNGLTFKHLKIKLTDDQFKNALKASATYNNWEIITLKQNKFKAINHVDFQRSGITIEMNKKDYTINYACYVTPSLTANPFTMGRRLKNLNLILENIKREMEGIDSLDYVKNQMLIDEHHFWQSSEWTFKKTIVRILLYSLCIGFFALTGFLLRDGSFIGIIPSFLAIMYLQFDLRILLAKRKKN